MTTMLNKSEILNGVDVAVLKRLHAEVEQDKAKGLTKWGVTTRWLEGAVTETEVTGCGIGGAWVPRRFKFRTDEPKELGGTNGYANPQEYLMGAFNACMVVGYVALSAMFGIELERVEIETKGEIDLRGFLGIDTSVKPGYDEIHYTVRIKGKGTAAQFEEIHRMVTATSPNRFNMANPIKLTSELVVG